MLWSVYTLSGALTTMGRKLANMPHLASARKPSNLSGMKAARCLMVPYTSPPSPASRPTPERKKTQKPCRKPMKSQDPGGQ